LRPRIAVAALVLVAATTGCNRETRQTPITPLVRHQATIGAHARSAQELDALMTHIVVDPGENLRPDDPAELQKIVQHLNDVEADACFSDFMRQRGPTLIEKEINDVNETVGSGTPRSTDEIVADLTTKQVTSALDIWKPSWADYAFHGAAKACAFENGDGHVHAKAACYYGSSEKEKGVTIAHELAHDLGYAHYTRGNQEVGNEMTIPYSTQYAVRACWDKVAMR